MKRYMFKILPVAMFVFLLPGCFGYRAGFPDRPGINTIHVPIFENRTFRRELEFQLTRAVVNEIKARMGLRIVPREKADSVLIGEIIDFSEGVLTEDLEDAIVESSVTVTMKVVWKDLRNNTEIVRLDRFTQSAEFIFATGENEATATAEAFQDIAEGLIDRLGEDWK